MQALIVEAANAVALWNGSVPDPNPGWARVRVRAAGICATDLAVVQGEFSSAFPMTPGHEWAGVVEAVGDPADARWVGQRVAGENDVGCLHCSACRTGQWRFCADYQQIGFGTYAGSYADYLVVPVYGLHALPDPVSFEQGALLEPLAVGMAVLRRAHLHVGDTLTIIGDGPVGLNTLIVARAAGARRVIVVGEQEARLACAEKLGALACDHRQGAIPTAVFRHHGRSQIVVEATGTAIGVQMALSVVAPEGRVVLAGYAHGRPVTIPADAVHLPNVQIVGAGNNPGWMGRTLACVADGVLASTQLVSHRYRLDQYAEALEQMRSRGNGLIKSLFTWEDF